jgi:hypothetical protein
MSRPLPQGKHLPSPLAIWIPLGIQSRAAPYWTIISWHFARISIKFLMGSKEAIFELKKMVNLL